MCWWKNAAVYQIYPKSFCDSNGDGIGDIQGIISKLDYLENLGVDVLWISPMYKSPGYDNGYDISDYFQIDPVFGDLEDFKELLAQAHERGLRIMMDLVVNHSSDENPWFLESKASRIGAKSNWYIWRDGHGEYGDIPPNDWLDIFSGETAWHYCEERKQFYLHMFSYKQPDLNWDCEGLRCAIYEMMRYWLEMGVDGFRMDAISYISKPKGLPDGNMSELVANGTKIHEFLREMRREVLKDFDTITVGETGYVTVEEAKKYANLAGSELNMVFHFEVNNLDGGESDKWNSKKIALSDLKAVYGKWQKELAGQAWNSLYLSNHDQPRSVSRLGDDSKPYRERSQKMLATCTYLMQGTPFIYQGEELGMTNNRFTAPSQLRDVESINAYKSLISSGLSKNVTLEIISLRGRDSARTPMQWTAEKNGGFSTGVPWLTANENYTSINAAEQLYRDDSVYNYYKKLLSFKKSREIFTEGDFVPIFKNNGSVFGYLRQQNNDTVMVLGNYTSVAVNVDLDEEKIKIEEIFMGNVTSAFEYNRLQPYEAVVCNVKLY
jgi:oligo-1,6-glucosidase